MIIPDILDYFL